MQQNSILSLPTAEFPQRYFRIIKQLGKGGQGEVFRAAPQNWGNFTSDVALKIQPQVQNEELKFIRSLIEYQNNEHKLPQNQKSQIIRVYDIVQHENNYIQIMELAELDLYSFLQSQKGNLNIWQKISIMKQISQSIWFLHFNKQMHRDLKPENFVKVNEEFKLIDFGTLKSNQLNKLHTSYVGTPLFYPPEISQGKTQYSIEIDIWSLGCTFYEILTENSFVNNLQNYQLKSNQQILLQVDKVIRQLLQNMLQKNSEQRISILQVITQLNQIESLKTINYNNNNTFQNKSLPPTNRSVEQQNQNDIKQKNLLLQQQNDQWVIPNFINQQNNFLGNNQQIKNNQSLQTDVNLSQIERLINQLQINQSQNFELIEKQLLSKPNEPIQDQIFINQTQQLQLNIQQEIKNQFMDFQKVMQEQIKIQFMNQIQNIEVNQKNQFNTDQLIKKVDEIKDAFQFFKDNLDEKINAQNTKFKSIELEIQSIKGQTQQQISPQILDIFFSKQNQQIAAEMRLIKQSFENNLNNEKIQFQQCEELQQNSKFQIETTKHLNQIQQFVIQSDNVLKNNQQNLERFSVEFDLIKSKLNEIQSQSQKIQFGSPDYKERAANQNTNIQTNLQMQLENTNDKIIENQQKPNHIQSSNQYNQQEKKNCPKQKYNFIHPYQDVQDVMKLKYQMNTSFSQNLEQVNLSKFENYDTQKKEDQKFREYRSSSLYSQSLIKNFEINLPNQSTVDRPNAQNGYKININNK